MEHRARFVSNALKLCGIELQRDTHLIDSQLQDPAMHIVSFAYHRVGVLYPCTDALRGS